MRASKKTVSSSRSAAGFKARRSGYKAETLACLYLYLKGYRIIARNFITGRGSGAAEIDIIARKGNLLIFIEVKKRKDLNTAAYAISPLAKRRLAKAAEAFLSFHSESFNTCDIRFDALLFGSSFIPEHLQDVWRVDWY